MPKKNNASSKDQAPAQPINQDEQQPKTPSIVVYAGWVMKISIVMLACYAAWLSMTVLSGFSDPVNPAQVSTNDSVPGNTAKNPSTNPNSAANQLKNAESIASVPIHELLQGQWHIAQADWTINMRSLATKDEQKIERQLLRLPANRTTFQPSPELQDLLDMAGTYAGKVKKTGRYQITTVAAEQFQAAVFADAKDPTRIFLMRAVSRITSDRPILIEVTPGNIATTATGAASRTLVQYDFPITPDDSFVITDQGRQDTSLLVVPLRRDRLAQFWVDQGWQIKRLPDAPGMPLILRGSRNSFRVEFIDVSETHTSVCIRPAQLPILPNQLGD